MSDRDQAIETQNNARRDANANHGSNCPDLTWSDELASNAQAWAEHMASIEQMVHSSGDERPNQGENLYAYWSTNSSPNFNDAANAWCNELANYHGENIGDGDFGSYGHYTQVVWPLTTQVGMGIAQGANGWWYVCGRYSPAGNMGGESAWGAK